jgi:3-oxoacyl-[acyl-carrier protein] reductase
MTYTALITGATKGIGADLAQRLLARDYTVISVARGAPAVTHPKLHSIEADLLDPAATAAAAAEVARAHKVTHLIHNAGLIWPNLLEEATPEDLAGLTQLHLGAALTLVQAVLPEMKARGFGRILFNGSRAALGVPTRTAYAATKAGILGMARTWALELAPHGITVNVVAPGPVRTDNFWSIVEKDSDAEAALARRIPVGRLGEVRDISNAFLFFCDPENGFVTGQTLYVCGGASVGTLDGQILFAKFLVVEHFLCRAVKHHSACIEDHRTVGQFQRADRVLLYDDRGDALLLDRASVFSISSTITGARPS